MSPPFLGAIQRFAGSILPILENFGSAFGCRTGPEPRSSVRTTGGLHDARSAERPVGAAGVRLPSSAEIRRGADMCRHSMVERCAFSFTDHEAGHRSEKRPRHRTHDDHARPVRGSATRPNTVDGTISTAQIVYIEAVPSAGVVAEVRAVGAILPARCRNRSRCLLAVVLVAHGWQSRNCPFRTPALGWSQSSRKHQRQNRSRGPTTAAALALAQ